MVGTKLTPQEARGLIRSGGNFTIGRIDLPTESGARPVTFEPPYALENGRDYAFHVAEGAEPELWEVEQSGDVWQWARRARRLGEIAEADATRH
jgi:hypothetical protein